MRILHTMIRVGDLQRSIDFYTQVLGMKLLRKTDYPERALHQRLRRLRRRIEVGGARAHPQLGHEVATTRHRLRPRRDRGRRRLQARASEVKSRGGKVTREAGPMKHGTTVIAFVEDPDGYKIELIQRKN